MPTAAILATAADNVRMSLVVRFGSSDLAFAAVSVASIGQITSQIQALKTIAVASQPIAGAYVHRQNRPVSTTAITPTPAATASRRLLRTVRAARTSGRRQRVSSLAVHRRLFYHGWAECRGFRPPCWARGP